MAGRSSSQSSFEADTSDWQERSITRTSSLASITSVDTPSRHPSISDAAILPRDLASVERFHNALLVHEKRLKANSSQTFLASTNIDRLIANYHAMISYHLRAGGRKAGLNGADLRKCARATIADAIDKYDRLLEERRKTLQEHGALLEIATETTHTNSNDRLLGALELQIAAATDLGEKLAARGAKTGWKAFKQSPCS